MQLSPAFGWLLKRLPSLLSPFILIGVWELVAQTHLFAANILIPPQQVFRTFLDLLADGELIDNIEASGARVLSGFAIGAGAGLIAGMAMGLYPALERYFGLLFTVIRQVPFIAWAPLLIVAFGIGETFKIIIIANAAFFPVALSTLDGVRNVPRHLKDVAALFRFDRLALMRSLVLPAALPSILTGVRLALSRSWMIVVAAELFAASSGIGHMMDWGRQMFQIDVVMVGVVVTGVVGFILDQMLRQVEAHFSSWKLPSR
jgi:sulfonate transport system permease protein